MFVPFQCLGIEIYTSGLERWLSNQALAALPESQSTVASDHFGLQEIQHPLLAPGAFTHSTHKWYTSPRPAPTRTHTQISKNKDRSEREIQSFTGW